MEELPLGYRALIHKGRVDLATEILRWMDIRPLSNLEDLVIELREKLVQERDSQL